MGLGFDGLREMARKAKTKIDEESTVFFLNKKQTAFKVIRGKDYIVYYRNGNKQIPLEALLHLPQAFGGSRTEMDKTIVAMLCSKMNIPKP